MRISTAQKEETQEMKCPACGCEEAKTVEVKKDGVLFECLRCHERYEYTVKKDF